MSKKKKDVSIIRQLFRECCLRAPNLVKIEQLIRECYTKRNDINHLVHTDDFPNAHLIDGVWVTALHVACKHGHLDIIDKLLDDSTDINLDVSTAVDVNAFDGGHERTALHWACYNGKVTVVRKLLLNRNIRVNELNSFGWSPLHEAYGRCDVLKELLQHPKIDVMKKGKHVDIPIFQACISESSDACEMLLKYQPQNYLLKQLNAKSNRYQRTPLHVACCNDRHGTIVKVILNHVTELDINAIDKAGNTPLHLICGRRDDKCDIVAVLILQQLLQQPSIRIHQGNQKGQTPLDFTRARLEICDSPSARSAYIEMIHILEQYHYQQRWQSFQYIVDPNNSNGMSKSTMFRSPPL
jgi:ankyrin repeat protein